MAKNPVQQGFDRARQRMSKETSSTLRALAMLESAHHDVNRAMELIRSEHARLLAQETSLALIEAAIAAMERKK